MLEIEKIMKDAEKLRQATHVGMRLGQLISSLEKVRPDAEVRFDFEYAKPAKIRSFRGYYSDLAIGFDFEGENVLCSDFITELKSCIGKTFEGYKGGDYIMSENTPVWVANYSNAGNTAVVNVTDDGWQVILNTAFLAD